MNEQIGKSIEELRAYNKSLERSPEYQRILPEVMWEVNTQFVKEIIAQEERWLSYKVEEEPIEDDDPIIVEFFKTLRADLKAQDELRKKRIEEAKELLPTDPARAAELLSKLGSCHTLWALQKRILKEKYGITWYTPAELNPDVKFD
ncbi:hypothetical protein [Xylanibacter ruminicola]|uniref:Uncharacterized protein n=1 Tax=Xylanibacter ruminicola TaxID=839 RepID=A0A1M6WQW0_XYLRU|nr:hypothetical protein [Xylanibacter ruminicola]SHK96150.1 hypothetical protein SAMN05216463_117105 [Xylanibacter ruminicola]